MSEHADDALNEIFDELEAWESNGPPPWVDREDFYPIFDPWNGQPPKKKKGHERKVKP